MRRSFLFLAMVGAAIAQTESQIQSEDVHRVGQHIACQCGACSENVNCNMSSGQCHFCKPARTKIWQMQQTGASDGTIIASFVKEYGQGIFRADPNSYFWMIPYLALIAGAGVTWMVVKRLRGTPAPKTAPAGGPPIDDDPVFARYRDAIEKDTEKLD
ncbi:MAG: cytochrome c-type biogenesis protein CcmH [Acidobacteriota bacterium]|nr:cytochrome c-type biogenesis protein CcmH [Acidobacteriota bacterium]